jgi:hypothetical protein
MMSGRKIRPFTGNERWNVAEGGDFFHESYVAVFSIDQQMAQKIDKATGRAKQVSQLVIVCAINFLRVENTGPKRSTLSFCTVAIDFDDTITFHDYAKIQREFECEANAFLRRTKAKKPNFKQRFAQIDLRRIRWEHWLQSE